MSKEVYIRERNEKLGKKVVNAFLQRHFDAYFCENKKVALSKALELIDKDDVIGWGGSISVGEIGLIDYLENNGYKTLNRDKAQTPQEKLDITKKSILADVFLMSANAISKDGQLVNIDGTGNRLAALCYGPKKVIVIAGMNKVANNLDDAVLRARTIAAPVNMQRISQLYGNQTPCLENGTCYDCKNSDTICAQFLTTRICKPAGRISVILVNEDLGF